MELEGSDQFREWVADDWGNLQSIWLELVPIAEDDSPIFRSGTLEPQQAGWVFERWLLEAFRISRVPGYHRFTNPMKASG